MNDGLATVAVANACGLLFIVKVMLKKVVGYFYYYITFNYKLLAFRLSSSSTRFYVNQPCRIQSSEILSFISAYID